MASKSRKPKQTLVEKRMLAGANVIKTCCEDGVRYTYTDNGKAARVDVVERLIAENIVVPFDDGLFAGNGQTWRIAQ